MKTNLIGLGIIVIFLGIALVFVGSFLSPNSDNTKVAVGGFLGPIPFGFGNDKTMVYTVMALSALIAVFFFITNLLYLNH